MLTFGSGDRESSGFALDERYVICLLLFHSKIKVIGRKNKKLVTCRSCKDLYNSFRTLRRLEIFLYNRFCVPNFTPT